MVSIIILSYNTSELLEKCLNSVYANTKSDFEVIVVDNASEDDSSQMIKKKFTKVKLIESKKNLGFASGVNLGAKSAQGEYILLLNSDTLLEDNSIGIMVDYLKQQSDVAILGGRLDNKDGSTSKSFDSFYNLPKLVNMLIRDKHREKVDVKKPIRVDWVSGGFMMIRKNTFEKLGGFDEKFFMYIEDMELCFRASKENFVTHYLPSAHVLHVGQGSSNRSFAIINIYKGVLYFYKKHHTLPEYYLVKSLLSLKGNLAILLGRITQNTYLVDTYKNALKF